MTMMFGKNSLHSMTTQPTPPARPEDFAWYGQRSSALNDTLRAAFTAPITRVEFEARLTALNDRLALLEEAFEVDVAPVCADNAALKDAVRRVGRVLATCQDGLVKVTCLETFNRSVQDAILERGIEALTGWTGKARAAVVYDSDVDEFTDVGLFNKVNGKRNIAVVGTTRDGDVLGGSTRLR